MPRASCAHNDGMHFYIYFWVIFEHFWIAQNRQLLSAYDTTEQYTRSIAVVFSYSRRGRTDRFSRRHLTGACGRGGGPRWRMTHRTARPTC